MLEVLHDRHTFYSIADEWNSIADQLGNPFLRHEWFSACIEAFGDQDELSIFVLRSGRRIRAIAPLIAVRRNGGSQLLMLDHRLCEPTGLLYEDEESLRLLVRGILRLGHPMRLYKLPTDSLEARILSKEQPWTHRCLTRPVPTSAWVSLSPDRAAFESRLSSRNRSFLRRKWKRAESQGPVTFDMIVPQADSVEAPLRDLFRMEASGWKGRQGTAVLSDPRSERFFMAYGREAARLGTLRLFFLKSGGDILAARMAVEFAGRLWDLKLAYNEHWRDCSPGILLTHEMLCRAGASGLTAHEFLGDTEHWERTWPIDERSYTAVRSYPLSATGAISLAYDVGHFIAQRIQTTGSRAQATYTQ